jgi:hypothetical protein
MIVIAGCVVARSSKVALACDHIVADDVGAGGGGFCRRRADIDADHARPLPRNHHRATPSGAEAGSGDDGDTAGEACAGGSIADARFMKPPWPRVKKAIDKA